MKISEVLGFPAFYQAVRAEKLPIKTAYKLSKLSKAVAKEVEFYQESFQKIMDTYAQHGEDGNYIFTEDGQGIQIQDGKQEECFKKIEELKDIDIEMPAITFKFEDFEDVSISADEMDSLVPFLDEE